MLTRWHGNSVGAPTSQTPREEQAVQVSFFSLVNWLPTASRNLQVKSAADTDQAFLDSGCRAGLGGSRQLCCSLLHHILLSRSQLPLLPLLLMAPEALLVVLWEQRQQRAQEQLQLAGQQLLLLVAVCVGMPCPSSRASI